VNPTPIIQWFLAIKKKKKINHCLQQAIFKEVMFKKLQYLLLHFLSFFLSLVPGEGRQPFTHIQKLLTT
jgi:hypothetical protein